MVQHHYQNVSEWRSKQYVQLILGKTGVNDMFIFYDLIETLPYSELITGERNAS